jgi:hypothetical protein
MRLFLRTIRNRRNSWQNLTCTKVIIVWFANSCIYVKWAQRNQLPTIVVGIVLLITFNSYIFLFMTKEHWLARCETNSINMSAADKSEPMKLQLAKYLLLVPAKHPAIAPMQSDISEQPTGEKFNMTSAIKRHLNCLPQSRS